MLKSPLILILLCLFSPSVLSRTAARPFSSDNGTGETKAENEASTETNLTPSDPLAATNLKFGTGGSDAPCGHGIETKEHLVTSVDQNTLLKWRTSVATEDGLCRISISKDIKKPKLFIVLTPVDNSSSPDGSFECNRRANKYESKAVSFPKDFTCDKCVLQFAWTAANKTLYSCSHITVLENQTKECVGGCLNGGVCDDGRCLCIKSFYGEHCELAKEKKDHNFIWLLFLLMLLLLISLGIGACNLSKSSGDEGRNLIQGEPSPPLRNLDIINRESENKPQKDLIGDVCNKGHILDFTRSEEKCAGGYYVCSNCNQVAKCSLGRWVCNDCKLDYCTKCKPAHDDVYNERAQQKPFPEEKKSIMGDDANMNGTGDLIRKVISSNQAENIPDHRSVSSSGKAVWLKTHFIFMIDCSGSMKGSRWDSVKTGFEECLRKLVPMKEVIVTGLTFDNKPNLFSREKTPEQALVDAKNMPFTGTGTNYKRCLEYSMGVVNKTVHVDYLICMVFLSDGLGGYPDRVIEELKDLKDQGKKFIFYSVACETNDDDDMVRMAKELNGEHYKVDSVEGIRNVFSKILDV